MSSAQQSGIWDGTPLTKFRVPRVRRDAIARSALIARLGEAIDSFPVTLLSAPGGYGKTTLMAQLAAEENGRVVVWIAVDEDDNDTARLFAALLRGLEPLQLAWEVDPRTLLANAAGSDTQLRAALAAVVNALCTTTAQRVVIMFDDLHRVDNERSLTLLEALIERLPDHVSLVFGTRLEPALPLARWRVHGELADFTPQDLEFVETEATALAMAPSAARSGATDPAVVRHALRRTHGWAAGLSLLLQSRANAERVQTQSNDRELFAYLAQEIVAELPHDLQDFVLQCSILAELNPTLCAAVSGRSDARATLEELYRRNLFLTAIDEQTPVLRFHDLFRDFLRGELERRNSATVPSLNERAGHAETSAPRAIEHFLRAGSWDQAMRRIAHHGEAMLVEGGHATLQRWIDSIPETERSRHGVVTYLRGICAWLRWDWQRAREIFGTAVELLTGPEQAGRRLRCQFMYADALSSSGGADRVPGVLDEIARQPLHDVARAQLALQRAWHAAPIGEPQTVGRFHEEFVREAEHHPERVCPATADLIHCVCIGMPRVAQSFVRYYELATQVHPTSRSPWKLAALAVGLWGYFWHGRQDEVRQLLQRAEVMQQQFGSIRLVAERIVQFKALYHGAIGQTASGIALTKAAIDSLNALEGSGHRTTWLRAYLHGLARQYWLAQDAESYAALLPQLVGPRRPGEWEFVEAAAATARGHMAILTKNYEAAEVALIPAVDLHARFLLPISYADPRIALAYAQLMQGNKARAWANFAPVYDDVIANQAVGLLLLEPTDVVTPLLEMAPIDRRRSAQHVALLQTLQSWRNGANASATAIPAGPIGRLSDREREVLAHVAAGASNKHIARDLALSLHTVKRHIANILDKLDCASRGQAADMYRREAG